MMKKKTSLPIVKNDRGITTLYVDGQPFQAFAGEVHNSAAYNPEQMRVEIWSKMDEGGLNTLIVPIYWEVLEPEERNYDFWQIDTLLGQAREYDKKLIFLWFGLWKNAESSYAPAWMKQDSETYFRAQTYSGEKLNTISPFCIAAIEKDALAFGRLMSHLRETDQSRNVIMVQVENEVGLLGTPRDYCPQADEAFADSVPVELLNEWKKSSSFKADLAAEEQNDGNWTEKFGEDAAEIFSAWYFAKALDKIASTGRKEYPIPCYTNVWLKQFPWYAGSYPSGGPVEDMLWVWKAAAPSIFAIAPDIYVSYVPEIMKTYSRLDNPLLIPEIRKDAITASYALYAFLNYHALCYAPFGIEDLWKEKDTEVAEEVLAALNISPLSFCMDGTREALSQVYHLLKKLQPLYLKYRGTGHLQCFMKQTENQQGTYLKFNSYNVEIAYLPNVTGKPVAAGAVFELEENRFLIVGMMCSMKFHTKPADGKKADFIRKETGTFQKGNWLCTGRCNGDEKIVTVFEENPMCCYFELYEY